MTLTFPAIVEHGCLRPVDGIDLPEGTEVVVTVIGRSIRRPADLLAEIAALPVQGSPEADVSVEHDRELYGRAPAP